MIELLLAIGAGWLLMGGPRRLSVGAALAVGWSIHIATFLMAIGLGGWAPGPWLLAIVVAVLAAWRGMAWWRVPRSHRWMPPRGDTRVGWAAAGALAVLAVWTLVIFCGVPLVNFDVLSYHLPQAWAMQDGAAGRAMLWGPQTFYERLPLGASIIEAPFAGQPGDGATGWGIQALMVMVALAAAHSAAWVAARVGARRGGRALAAALVLLFPMQAEAVLQGLFDPMLGLFALAGLELLLAAMARPGRDVYTLAAGAVAGSALALKLNAAGTVIVPLAAAGVVMAVGRGWWRHALAFNVGLVAAALPWGLRTLVLMRGGGDWTAEQAAFVVTVHEPLGVWSSTFWADAIAKRGTLGLPLPLAGVSASLVIAIVWAAMHGNRRHMGLVLGCVAGYLLWLTVRQNPARFLLPCGVLLLPLAATAVAALGRVRWLAAAPGVARAGAVAVAAALLVSPALRTQKMALALDPVYTADEREMARGALLGEPVVQMVRLARGIGGDGRLLLMFEARRGLFPAGTQGRTVWDQPAWAPVLKASATAQDFADALRAAGVAAIFVNEPEWGRAIDFYARERQPTAGGGRWFGRLGLNSPVVTAEEVAWALEAFPPHRHAGLGQRDLTVLAEFLVSCRAATVLSAHAGMGAEIWYARIPEELPRRPR